MIEKHDVKIRKLETIVKMLNKVIESEGIDIASVIQNLNNPNSEASPNKSPNFRKRLSTINNN